MYDFTINMYINFKSVDGFYMMIRFYDNNDIHDDFMIILYDIWYDFDDITTWHIDLYIIWWYYKMIYYMMILHDDIIWWWDVIRTQWWLRSTTGFYGWTCYKGRIWGDYDSLRRGCLRDVSSKIMVEVLSWYITHGRHTQVNTNVGTAYDFFGFHDIKFICIMF